ncbi:MAG: 2-C-methyl-D-erythritol 2,4-cyclodiphosphate synthase [Anaerovoracaceae bacterium]
MRTGSGYDVHRLVAGRPLILGGKQIDFPRGLEGHSDADVLLHAVMDALLGAAAMGDIGRHFPDTDEKYRGASSMDLLRQVRAMIEKEGYAIANLDVTLIAERPKVAAYIDEMKKNISAAANVAPERVNIKGTTTEGLGFTGTGEGIACQAVCILTR